MTPSPGTHNTNYFTGDLLLAATLARPGSQTIATPTGWTLLDDFTTTAGSTAVFARIADGGANDVPSLDWDANTSRSVAWIDVFYGDVYTDLSTIVAHTDTVSFSGVTVIPVPALTVTTDNCLIYAFGLHKNDATVATVTTVTASSGQGMTLTNSYILNTANAGVHAAAEYWQQTTATNFNGNDMTLDGDPRSGASLGVIFALKTLSTTTPKLLLLGVG